MDSTNPKDRLGIKKPSTWVTPDTANLHLGMAMRDGGLKYGPYNWRDKAVIASVYLDAMDRHKILWKSGERLTKDTRVHHLGAIMACCAILIDAEETGNLIDDRPKSDRVIELMSELEQQIAEEIRDEYGRITGFRSDDA